MEEISNSTFLTLWNDVKNGGTSLVVLCFFMFLYFIKPYMNSILGFFGNLLKGKIEHKSRNYSANDIKNHPIFKDLEFWLDIGIKSLKINNINIQYPLTRIVHTESEDYLKAKEEIAKDILTIKFKVVKEYVEKFLEENPIDKADMNVIRSNVDKYVSKCEIKQYNDMIENGVPQEFLKKYYIYERMALDLLRQNVKALMDDKTFDMPITSRIYLVLTALNNYLAESYNTMLFVVGTINGDLNGVEYKGHIIGKKKETILQPPSPSLVIPAQEKLKKILYEFGASRVTLMRYYEKNGEIYHSTVYEVCDAGVTPAISVVQDVSSTPEMEVLNLLRNNTVIAVDISKLNNHLSERLSHRGVNGIILSPVFEGDKLIAALVVDYLSIHEFEARQNMDIDSKMHDYCKELTMYVSYPSDYKF